MKIALVDALLGDDLLSVVIGRDVIVADLTASKIPHAQVMHTDHPLEMHLHLGGAGAVPCRVLEGLTDAELSRLDYYQSVQGLCPDRVETHADAFSVYVPIEPVGANFAPWSYPTWADIWGDLACEAAREIMQHYGLRDAAQVRALLHGLRLRASARLRGPLGAARPMQFQGEIEIAAQRMSYANFFALKEYDIQVEQFQGGLTPPMTRAAFLGMDAAIVLPYDPARDRILLIEQMRLGPLGRGDPNPWQFEPIAGHVDPGETPTKAALREAQEEAGLTIARLIPIAECYPSPGASSEFYYIYIGLADLPDGSNGVSGVEAEGENIRSHILSFDEFMGMADRFELSVAPLLTAAFWLANNRDLLRDGELS